MYEFISLGAGVQSTPLIVLNAEKMISNPTNVAIFADTGSERPETYDYLERVIKPYAAAKGVEIITIDRTYTGHEYDKSLEAYSEHYKILPSTKSRWCTDKFKMRPINHYLAEQGITECLHQVGISTDEAHRAKEERQAKRYPLLEIGYSRGDCEKLILDKLGELPVKSGCYFCPYASKTFYKKLDEEHPELLVKAIHLEGVSRSKKRPTDRKNLPVWGNLAKFVYYQMLPGRTQIDMFAEEDFSQDTGDDCETGYCMR
jgi:hypothetical protein